MFPECASPGRVVLDERRRVEAGGDQFTDGTLVVSSSNPYAESSLYTGSLKLKHRPAEFGSVPDVLATDPYYAHSYSNFRYDDFKRDSKGRALTGLMQRQPVVTSYDEGDAILERVGGSVGVLSEDALKAVLAELAEADRPQGNCVLLTGGWQVHKINRSSDVRCWLWQCYKCVTRMVLLALAVLHMGNAQWGVWLALVVLQTCHAVGVAGSCSFTNVSRGWCG
jgi:hypothetical protein